MKIEILFSGVPVSNFGAAVPWYSTLFGRAPDVTVTEDEVMWQLTETSWLYVIDGSERAGKTLITMLTADLEGAVELLGTRGIVVGQIQTVGEAGRRAVVIDPDGNSLAFIELNRTD